MSYEVHAKYYEYRRPSYGIIELLFSFVLLLSISPNVYLMEAKRLKHAADTERDLVSQGMQYLEAILSFVLTGHVLERRNQIDTAFSMYSETLKLIVYV